MWTAGAGKGHVLQAFLKRYWVPGCYSLVNVRNWMRLHHADTARRWRLLYVYWHWITSRLQNAHFVSWNTDQLKKKNNNFTRGLYLKFIFIKYNKPCHSPGSRRWVLFTGLRFISKATAGQVLIISSSASNTTHLPPHSLVSGPNRSKFGKS
jgi:hypothetical protein